MSTVLLCGGTGLIGKRLTQLLIERNHRVIILTRNQSLISSDNNQNPTYAHWDPSIHLIDLSAIQKADHIINLSGANLAAKRWTAKRKHIISESRKQAGELLVSTLKENPNQVETVINASAIGWYGSDAVHHGMATPFTEDMPPGADFIATVCRLWEESIDPITLLNKRLVKIRTGLVLSAEGGLLHELMKPARLGLATFFGNGKQMQSWIHIDDLCRIYIHALENQSLHGTYNAVAPKPVENKMLVTAVAQKMKGSFYITAYVPSFLLKWILGEMSKELIKSTTVDCTKIHSTGFKFIFPSLEAALNDLL